MGQICVHLHSRLRKHETWSTNLSYSLSVSLSLPPSLPRSVLLSPSQLLLQAIVQLLDLSTALQRSPCVQLQCRVLPSPYTYNFSFSVFIVQCVQYLLTLLLKLHKKSNCNSEHYYFSPPFTSLCSKFVPGMLHTCRPCWKCLLFLPPPETMCSLNYLLCLILILWVLLLLLLLCYFFTLAQTYCLYKEYL